MYLKEFLKQFDDQKIKIFVDMDGVIVDYVYGSVEDFDKRRALVDNLKKLEIISKMPNVELYILSATRYSKGREQKNWWLDQYAPFFKRENRIILSRDENDMKESSVLKAEYLTNIHRDGSILILIDDDPKILRTVENSNEDIILKKDTVLVDDTTQKIEEIINDSDTLEEVKVRVKSIFK